MKVKESKGRERKSLSKGKREGEVKGRKQRKVID